MSGIAASLSTIVILAAQAALAQVPQITSFTPAAGAIGSKIIIKGTALSAPIGVTIDGVAAKFTGNSATQVTATVPATGSGLISITTAGGTGTSATAFTVTPSLTLTPTGGHPNVNVTVTGAGFGPYTSIDVYFDTSDVALAVSNGLGVVSATVQVPLASQPGTHWITVDERANHDAAQEAFTVGTNWLMPGFAASGAGHNPFENTLNTGNIAGLTDTWAQTSGGSTTKSPFVEVNGSLLVADSAGIVYSYSSAGQLLWTAVPGADMENVPPASNGGLVFFGDSSGNVNAYKTACRNDGGTCAPTWTTNIGTPVTAGLVLYQGVLEVPGGDGSVHPLTPATGVPGTPFYALDNTHGPVTTPVAFAADGSYYYGAGPFVEFKLANGGGSSVVSYFGNVSAIVNVNGAAYATTVDGYVHRITNPSWDVSLSIGGGVGCGAVAVANGRLYAGACGTAGNDISAFEPYFGTVLFAVGAGGNVTGLTVANGVLYACVRNLLFAYDASNLTQLWDGGGCSDAPVVANGNVYGALNEITQYSLPQLSAAISRTVARPAVSALKPDYRLPARRTPEKLPDEGSPQ
jgi:hypothetical protein